MKVTQLKQLHKLLSAEPFKDNIMTIEQVHGFLCAVISGPITIPAKTWLAAVYGSDKKLMAHEAAAEINPLITQLHAELAQALEREEEIKPLLFANSKVVDFTEAAGELLASWCAGYMAGVSANQQAWLGSGHHDIYGLLTPISAFAQFFDGNQPKDDSGTEINPQTIREQYLSLLPGTLTNIYHFWRQHQGCNHAHHHHHSVATFRHETPKPGRNDLCHCGSGKKYKKCCAA